MEPDQSLPASVLWLSAVSAAVIGTSLVFGATAGDGLFIPGVVMIDIAVLLAIAASLVQLRARRATPARSQGAPGAERAAPRSETNPSD